MACNPTTQRHPSANDYDGGQCRTFLRRGSLLSGCITSQRQTNFWTDGNSPTYSEFPDAIYRFLKLDCTDVLYCTQQVQVLPSTACAQH